MITIRPFTAADLPAAGNIALELWGNEVPQIPAKWLPLFYQYLPRYYFHAASPLNLAAVDDRSRLRAFLLAVPGTLESAQDEDAAYDWMKAQAAPEIYPLLDNYRAYLDGNRQKEDAARQASDAVMLLYASVQPGCGRALMNAFTEVCRREKLESLFLWTDETCDWEYYPAHGFTEVAKLRTEPALFELELHTYLYRKYLGNL